MAVLTLGNVRDHVLDILGARTSETRVVRVVDAAINTAHTLVCLEAAAAGADWTRRIGVRMTVTSTDTSIIMPDGQAVLDANGAIPVKCIRVTNVYWVPTGQRLTYRPKDVVEAELGQLSYIGRNLPMYWDQYGTNTSGQRLLWLMPYPSVAGTIDVDYVGGLTTLTQAAQALMPPEEFRELVAQISVANCTALDSVDPIRFQRAEQNADRIWRCVRAVSFNIGSNFQSPTQIMGQFQ